MKDGRDPYEPYVRNPKYQGDSVLGVIARDDVTYAHNMPSRAEVNGTLMSVEGRVGMAGISIDENGEPVEDAYYGLTYEERLEEYAYNRLGRYKDKRFVKKSLRRLGGLISNTRIMETYIKPRGDGTAYVAGGFKTGNMQFDYNLLFNPPPNFVSVPRPVVTSFVPVFFVRGTDG